MSEQDRQNLIEEANVLGLEFPPNIPSVKLQQMVNEKLATLPPATPEPVIGAAPPGPAVKPEEVPTEEDSKDKPKIVQSKELQKRLRIKAKKDAAMKTRVVTITNKDNRENDVMTTVYLSFENQYFGLSKLVPLDIPVELEEALIRIAESTTMTLHKDEIVAGKRTGNKVPVTVKKFAVSYSQQQVD